MGLQTHSRVHFTNKITVISNPEKCVPRQTGETKCQRILVLREFSFDNALRVLQMLFKLALSNVNM